jgi:hypothetical protein
MELIIESVTRPRWEQVMARRQLHNLLIACSGVLKLKGRTRGNKWPSVESSGRHTLRSCWAKAASEFAKVHADAKAAKRGHGVWL